jgi:hypothetical protein
MSRVRLRKKNREADRTMSDAVKANLRQCIERNEPSGLGWSHRINGVGPRPPQPETLKDGKERG